MSLARKDGNIVSEFNQRLMDTKFCLECLFSNKGIDVSVDHIKAYYLKEEDVLVIYGSNDIWDWLTSLKILALGEMSLYHGGYYAAAKRLHYDLERREINPGQIIGYSLGGALACILESFTFHSGKPVVTIGSPNYIAGEESTKRNITHYLIREDWVTKVPFFYTREGRRIEFATGIKNPFKAHSLKKYAEQMNKC